MDLERLQILGCLQLLPPQAGARRLDWVPLVRLCSSDVRGGMCVGMERKVGWVLNAHFVDMLCVGGCVGGCVCVTVCANALPLEVDATSGGGRRVQ